MNNIKYSILWAHDIENTVFFNLLKNLSKKKFKKTKISDADIVFLGPYDNTSFKRKFLNKICSSLGIKNNFFSNLDIYSIKRSYVPLRIFMSHENYRPINFSYDFSITPNLGIDDENHFRFPSWKDYIDWSDYEIFRENNTLNALRFGEYYNQKYLLEPLSDSFMKKKRDICLFTSHMNEPRRSLFSLFSKYFKVDGYGPYFERKIKNHNMSNFKKKNIMQKYAFNLCPHNSLFPGYYEEKIPDAFLSKCLPISWADQNIKIDFNPKSFVNLLNYVPSDYTGIIKELKSDEFLKKFSNEPLILKEVDLEKEIKFVNKILSFL